jgi:putative pyrroloquinoline-quinone binding quinoprotein
MSSRVSCLYGSAGRWQPETVALDLPLILARPPMPGDDFLSPPILDGERAFCVSRPQGIVALRLANGKEVWRLPTQPAWGSCQLDGQRLLAVPRPGVLVVLDPITGAQLDSQSVGELTLDFSVVTNGRIISPMSAGTLGAWDLESRSLAWRVPSSWNLSLIAASNRVVCVSEAHACVALDVATGKELWRFDLADLGRHKTLLHGERPGAPLGHAIVSEDVAYIAVTGGWLVALELISGTPRWKLNVESVFPRNFSLSPEGSLFLLSDDSLTTIDAVTGAVRAHKRISGQKQLNGDGPFAPASLSERFLWTVDATGDLVAISRSDASIALRYNVRGRVAQPPVIGASRLFLVDLNGRLSIFAAPGSSSDLP